MIRKGVCWLFALIIFANYDALLSVIFNSAHTQGINLFVNL